MTTMPPIGKGIITNQSRVSLRAKLLAKLAAWFGPDYKSEGVVHRAIAADRAKGPAYPPKALRSKIHFTDEVSERGRFFLVTRQGQPSSKLRIFYLHGGAYILDLQEIQWKLIWALLQRTNAEIVVPIYPLAPEHTWQESMEMIYRSYLAQISADDQKATVVVGDSAGGGLALALAQQLRDNGGPAPAGLILFSPFLDASLSGADQPALERRDPVLSISFLRDAGRMWAGDLPPADPRVSPLFGNHDGLPEILVFTGTRDILDSDAKRLNAHGSAAVIHEYPDMMHVWPIAPIPEARRALKTAIDFIVRVAASDQSH